MSSPGEITQLLQLADSGDEQAANALFKLVQEELKAIAHKRKRNVGGGKNLSVTGLIDEAFCRLVGQNVTLWQAGDRRKFFVYAATKIHNLLIQTGRAQAAQKRGGDRRQVEMEGWEPEGSQGIEDMELLADLQSALAKLDSFAHEEAIAFRIRYFLGCTFEETADIMDISETEARRRFKKAQLLLQRELKDYHHES